jgi:hypothetical protein
MLKGLRRIIWRECIGMRLCCEVVCMWSLHMILGLILLALRRH